MRAGTLLLLSAAFVTGCGERMSESEERRRFFTETSNGAGGVGPPDSPVEKMAYGMIFRQMGLEIDRATVFIQGPDSSMIEGLGIRELDIKAPVWARDTVNVGLLIRGWKVVQGRGTMGYSSLMRAPDGRVVRNDDLESKTVMRWSIDSFDTFIMDFTAAGLDTTVPYYDCEYRVWDKLSGRSLSGTYRLHLKPGKGRS